MFRENPGMEPALGRLGFEGLYDELVEQVRHITADLDAQGRLREYRVRALMQARRDGARRTPLIVTADDQGRLPRFRPVAGCRIGRTAMDLETGVFATELVLERDLARGELCPYELSIELGDPEAETFVDHYAARRLREVMVWVRFDPARVPAHVERYSIVGDQVTSQKLELGDGCTAHALERGFGPGIVGLRWDW
jgi:hypothetical protein